MRFLFNFFLNEKYNLLQHMKTVDRAPMTPAVDVVNMFPDKKALSDVTCYKVGLCLEIGTS